MNNDDRVIEYIRKGNNVNYVKLSSEYDNNCSESEYEIVSDAVLEALITADREFASLERHERNHTISLSYNDEIKTNSSPENFILASDKAEKEREKAEQKDIIISILSELTPLQKKRLYKLFCEGAKLEEIASAEGVAASSIHESINWAYKRLRKYGHILLKRHLAEWVYLLK